MFRCALYRAPLSAPTEIDCHMDEIDDRIGVALALCITIYFPS
jgi:hypothetical protein